MPIVTDTGFRKTSSGPCITAQELPGATGRALCVHVANDQDPAELTPYFDRIAVIVIAFPVFSDGRGFSLATRLRGLGYRRKLRANGHLIADQYAYARACGFDEVEIDDGLAARQPEHHWLEAAALSRPYREKWHGVEAARPAATPPHATDPYPFYHF
jgi:uncharacterized protein (DUF934 family)